MAQVISVDKKPAKPTLSKKNTPKQPPLFHKQNYILMVIGAVILFIGFICIAGGGSDDPTQFSEAIFDTRRLTVAPILMVAGLVIEIFAIMWRPRKKQEQKELEA